MYWSHVMIASTRGIFLVLA